MKKTIAFLYLFLILVFCGIAQESEEQPEQPEKDKPVRSPFESGYLIDQQTTVIKVPKTLEYVIQHKFGPMTNGRSDLWGLYAPGANIRLGLNYVILKNVQIGAGITKKNMYSDLNLKWTVLEQTRKNTIPVAVTLYGNIGIDGRDQGLFDEQRYRHSSDPNGYNSVYGYRFPQRLSYFSQLIVGRKFSERITLQAGVSFSHYNLVASTGDHDKIGAHLSGRVKFSPQSSIIFNYDVPLKIKNISEQLEWTDHPRENLAIGWEISTSTHAFQIYVGSADGILQQDMMMYNRLDWRNKGLSVGFVITRLWNF